MARVLIEGAEHKESFRGPNPLKSITECQSPPTGRVRTAREDRNTGSTRDWYQCPHPPVRLESIMIMEHQLDNSGKECSVPDRAPVAGYLIKL